MTVVIAKENFAPLPCIPRSSPPVLTWKKRAEKDPDGSLYCLGIAVEKVRGFGKGLS